MSTVPATLSVRPLSLEQLAAPSEEIAALARAGVPLDRGLAELARDIPGRLGTVAREMSQRLSEGQIIEQVAIELGNALPPAYRSVLIAGVRAAASQSPCKTSPKPPAASPNSAAPSIFRSSIR